jgi:hypothetical protein
LTYELNSLPPKGDLDVNYVLLVGQSPLSADPRLSISPLSLAVEVRLDPADTTATEVTCRELTPFAATLLRETIEGRRLELALADSEVALRQRYFGPNKDALLLAVAEVRRQFGNWSRRNNSPAAYAMTDEASTDPSVGAQPSNRSPGSNGSHRSNGSNGSHGSNGVNGSHYSPTLESTVSTPMPPKPALGRANGHHNLATLLVTLLAHSRLLDGRGWQQPPGTPLSTETRRQAIQLYAAVQQILHSVEAEPGLLQPQIEPIALPALVGRALKRSSLPGHNVNVSNLLPSDLTPARGDEVVLEEALVMLFDEIGSYADSVDASLEITAEMRRTDMLLTMELIDGRDATPLSDGLEDETAAPTSLLEQMWRCGLGTLAARALVEHQGGRLWMQDSFPKDLPSLCMSLQAHQPQDEDDQPETDTAAGAPIVPSRQKRITALWR